ncbi:oxygen-independent coproporphyrinogen III oxidase [Terrarubrum flagellatum]|uniref:oxygen-independent coproporphyrinogen III oxidase n=1 Tax=Terrirubrum flagellatum TaxID=2895980 RepID=UPI00314562D2
MNEDILAKYEARRLPRYTSYPTAPHFGVEVDSNVYRRWLEELPAGISGSLYIHIPFCNELCLYCGCHTNVAHRYESVSQYRELLATEISKVGQHVGDALEIQSLHWGGGSPTILRPEDFLTLTDALRKTFRFAVDAETAIEIDPRTFTRDRAEALGQAGVTRASIGVQSFAPAVQRAVRRVQSLADTQRVVEWLRAAGVARFNVDLMYGLPHQTVRDTTESAIAALTLDPDRIALFGYAHVPWMKRHQALLPEESLPGAGERRRQFEEAASVFVGAGYVRIGFDHFAKPDDPLASRGSRLRRNFQGFTTDEAPALIGLGASAISSLPQGYAQNVSSVAAYRKALAAGWLATARGVALTDEDRLRRDVIERLMCDLSVDLGAVCDMHGVDLSVFSIELESVAALARDGVASLSGARISISEGVRGLARVVGAVFDARLTQAGRHAPVA